MSELSVFNNSDERLKDKRVWVKFINSLTGFKSVNLVASKSKSGLENLAIFSSAVHLGAKPPLIGMVFRPHSDQSRRHSLLNIEDTGFFTINHVNSEIYKKAHQTSARYSEEESEFKEVGLTSTYKDDFHAPFVKESLLQMSMKHRSTHFIEENKTYFVVAEVLNVYTKEEVLREDGSLDIEALNTVTVCGLDSYHKTTKLARLSYAKPNKKLEEI